MNESDQAAPTSAKVEIYTRRFCGFCVRAKQLLDDKGVAYIEIKIDGDPELRQYMIERSGGYTVPQIFINDQPVGGCTELYELEYEGRLDELLAQ